MLGDIRKLGRETAIYGVSTVLSRLLNFLLVPLYTHWLAPSDYGLVATAFAYIAFLNILYQYGMDQAYLRFASPQEPGSPEEKFSTPVLYLLASSAVLSAILWAAAGPLASAGGLAGAAAVVKISAIVLFLDALAVVPFAELRLAHRSWYFVGAKTANIVVNVALNVVFLWKLHWGVEGVFWASAAASAATLALLVPVIASKLRARPDGALGLAMLRFAAPYVPAGLASMAVQVIDRPILLRLTDPATVGVYQANYRLGIFMALAVNMFDAAWRPFFLERAGRPDAPGILARVLTYFLAGGLALLLALSVFMGDLARFAVYGRPLIDPAYWPGLAIVPVVLAGYLFNGLYINFMAQVMIAKRSDLLVIATACGALVNIGANFLLIPGYGMMGAALATLAAYASMAAALFLLGQRLYPVPYEYGRLLHLSVVFLAACALLYGLSRVTAGAAWTAARAGGILFLPAALAASGFFTRDEREALGRRLKNPGPWT